MLTLYPLNLHTQPFTLSSTLYHPLLTVVFSRSFQSCIYISTPSIFSLASPCKHEPLPPILAHAHLFHISRSNITFSDQGDPRWSSNSLGYMTPCIISHAFSLNGIETSAWEIKSIRLCREVRLKWNIWPSERQQSQSARVILDISRYVQISIQYWQIMVRRWTVMLLRVGPTNTTVHVTTVHKYKFHIYIPPPSFFFVF
jgi:hypothetical protein